MQTAEMETERAEAFDPTPAKTRKPRGPNKPKVAPTLASLMDAWPTATIKRGRKAARDNDELFLAMCADSCARIDRVRTVIEDDKPTPAAIKTAIMDAENDDQLAIAAILRAETLPNALEREVARLKAEAEAPL